MSIKRTLFNSNFLHSITRIFNLSFSKTFWQKGQNSNYFRKVIIGCGLFFSLGYVNMIEDETIRNLKLNLNR